MRALTSATQGVLADTCVWDGESDDSFNRGGLLGVQVLNTTVIAAGQLFVFSFSLINPAGPVAALPQITASWSGAEAFVSKVMNTDSTSILPLPGSMPGDAVPLKVSRPKP